MQLHRSSPHAHQALKTSMLMRYVIFATIPGLLAMIWVFGWGVLVQVVLASVVALVVEGVIVTLRNRPLSYYLGDYSVLLTAVLLALAIPPTSPWWVTVIGTVFAVLFGKQLYGGLGNNPFNPAMLGYVLLLISFPIQMTQWLPASDVATQRLSFLDSASLIFTEQDALLEQGRAVIDGVTAATPLDAVKTAVKMGHSVQETQSSAAFGVLAGTGWQVVNIAFLLGGLVLLSIRAISWHIPVSLIGSLLLISTVFYLIEPSKYADPLFHLFSGGTMLGAFFIATDPVTAATSNRGRIVYGAGIGILVYIIRSWGGYPDAIAFAVLLMNIMAPTLDYYTKPRTYGHSR